MREEIRELCKLDREIYKCISKEIDSDIVVLTSKSDIHIVEHHPEAYKDVLIELKETIIHPDYIFKDDKHADTGLVVREILGSSEKKEHTFIVLKICTDSEGGKLANSIISGWKISEKRLQSYIRNKEILYRNK